MNSSSSQRASSDRTRSSNSDPNSDQAPASDHNAADQNAAADSAAAAAVVSKKNKYRKDKPWDTPDIDHWRVEEFREGDMVAGPLVEESTFATLFPKYLEPELRTVWPEVTRALGRFGITCELNLIKGSMTVTTTRKTWDPFMILKARDLIKLLSRSVPFAQAQRILEDDMVSDIIQIGNMVRNKDRFVKRRQRLIGPHGATLKAIELLTGCYVRVQGNTVAAMGGYKGLKSVRRIAEDCMRNIHPIYNIKSLMIRRELAKDEAMKTENWDRFLPKFKKQNVKRKRTVGGPDQQEQDKQNINNNNNNNTNNNTTTSTTTSTTSTTSSSDNNNESKSKSESSSSTSSTSTTTSTSGKPIKKKYTPFPPLPTPSKIDKQIESGEYFLKPAERERRQLEQKQEQQTIKRVQKQQERESQFVAPKSDRAPKRNRDEGSSSSSSSSSSSNDMSAEQLAKKLKKNIKNSSSSVDKSSKSGGVKSLVADEKPRKR